MFKITQNGVPETKPCISKKQFHKYQFYSTLDSQRNVMGSCLGRCRWAKKIYSFRYWQYDRKFEDADSPNDDMHDRSEQLEENVETDFKSKFRRIASVFSKLKPRKDSSLRLELLDDAWCSSDNEFSYPVPQNNFSQLKNKTRSVHSTPANSVELEWEHLPEMVQHKLGKICSESVVAEEVCSGTSASAWSRGSSRDSLEWDPRGDTMNTDEDETEKLLQEIERLSSRALQETSEWTS